MVENLKNNLSFYLLFYYLLKIAVMNFIEKLLTLYWPQTTLVLLAIGYFIKRVLDNKSKKIEINYTIFQQKRLEALQNFISAYSSAEQMWREINLDEVATKTITAEKLDEILELPMKKMKNSVFELQVYLDNEDYILFEKILSNTTSYRTALTYLFFYSDKSAFELLSTFKTNSSHFLEDNRVLIKQVNNIVKKTFK